MAETKVKKAVTVQVPDDVSVDLVASAIRARGIDDGGAKVCSVKKIKDYILEKEPNRDIQMLNKRLKEALILGVEENVIQRPTQQSHAKTDLRGSFQVSGDANNDKEPKKKADSTGKTAAKSSDKDEPEAKGARSAVDDNNKPANPKSNEASRSESEPKGKKSKKAIISDDEEEEPDGETEESDIEKSKTSNENVEEQPDGKQEEVAEEHDEEVNEESEENEENEEAEEEELDEGDEGEEEQFDEEEVVEDEDEEDDYECEDDEDSPTKAFLPKSRKGLLSGLTIQEKECKSMKGRKL